MDYQIQVVTVPVTDVDQAAAFYTQQAGFALDVDYHPAGDFRVVQLTPPGSACSVQFGVGLTDAAPGSARARTWPSPTSKRPVVNPPTAGRAPERISARLGTRREAAPAKKMPASSATAFTGVRDRGSLYPP